MKTGELYRLGPAIKGGLHATKTVNLNSGMTTAEIQALIDDEPKFIPVDKILTFQFADGAYVLDNSLVFEGFHGAGRLRIYGNTGEPTSLYTTQAVYLDFASAVTDGLVISGCSIRVEPQWLKVRVDTTSGSPVRDGLQIEYSTGIFAKYCYILGNGTTNGRLVHAYYSHVNMENVYVSNANAGFFCEAGFLFSNTNDDTGTQPLYGLYSREGGVIGKQGTQPAGSTSNEFTVDGGVIR